jgi:hypothetical protein
VGKQNLTVSLESDTVRRAKTVAAKRGLSVSALVAQQIEDLTAADERYERARDSALRMMADVEQRASSMEPSGKDSGWTWNREELYEERLGRYGR